MKNNIVSAQKFLFYIGGIMLLLTHTSLYAQFGGGGGGGGSITIAGPTTVTQGETKTYTISNSSISSTTWTVTSNAQVISSFTQSATIKFNSGTGAQITAVSTSGFFDTYMDTHGVNIITPPPANPSSPTVSNNNCGTATLTRSGSPPSGVTWYWQGKNANGTATNLGSGSSFTANQGTGTYYIRARNSSGTWSSGSGSRYVSIASFQPGSISGTQTVCYSGDPSTLGNSASASGGNGYSYQWQYSNNGSNGWTNIGGATATTYNPPGGLTSSRWYRRRVSSCGTTKYSNVIKVTVRPNLNAGSISYPQSICYNGNPATLISNSNASGGNGTYTYQWQYSNNGTSGWTNISGTNTAAYDPPSGLTASRWYRRRVSSCGQTKYTDTVKVTVAPNLVPGSISSVPAVCYNGDPNTLGSASNASGGNGLIVYQWQYSNNGTSGWTNISGTNTAAYDPPSGLTTSRWYRRRAVSCSQTTYTNTVKVTVNPALTAGNIAGVQTICYSENPTALTSSSNASGGDGNHTYQWQYSNNGTSGWTNISGTNTAAYDPPSGLTASRWYRRRVSSCGQTLYTSTIKVTVQPNLLAGSINNAQTICSNENPESLGSASNASGGDGTHTYQWQYSNNGTSGWTNISGTNTAAYDPPSGLTASRWYRRRVSSCSQTLYTNVIKITVIPVSTWYLDADNDGFAISTTSVCSNPGSGYTQNVLPLGDLNDNNVNITNITPQNFYQDTDGDGYGDPNVSVFYSNQPSGYVTNNNDQCPGIAAPGSGNGCLFDPYDQVTISTDQNYIYTRVPQVAMSNIDNNALQYNADIIDQVAYFDGLGRGLQSTGIKQSPNGKDMVTHMQYDNFGRQVKQYLPYTTTANSYGSLKTADQDLATKTFYKNQYPDDFTGVSTANVNAYSESLFENSPLNRPLKQAAPGKDWKMGSGHEISFEYLTNVNNEVPYFEVTFASNNSEAPQLSKDGFYTQGELSKVITKDENWTSGKDHTTEEFTDKQGRVVLKRTYDNQVAHDTYYVYDDFGNLTYVLPPKVTTNDGVSTTELSELCYQYKYDYRNRLIEKKIPGKGWEYIIYNKLDQPIMTQDPNLRAQNKWLFTKYDAFGRVAYTGMATNSGSRATVQTAADAVGTQFVTKVNNINAPVTIAGTNIFYTNVAYPTVGITELHTINYYDNTTFDKDGLTIPATTSFGSAIITTTKSLATGSKVRVLGTNNWITTLTGYDYKRRPVYVVSKNNELGTTDIVESKLDFVGKVLETKTTHTKGSNTPIITIEKFTYDHAARLLTQTHKIGSNPEELMVSNTYDELGQLIEKGVGGKVTNTNRLQSVDYSYNVRGWLKAINDVNNIGNDLFSFKINYNDPTSGTALYNGNISQTHWKTANTDSSLKNYTYTYDALNRIMAADFNSADNSMKDWFKVFDISYDKNGNINTLKRHKKGSLNQSVALDYLSYTYDSGNKLLIVEEQIDGASGFEDGSNSGNDFEYDQNGNMIIDRNKGITSITYNHLNLPTEVVFDNNQDKKITYLYDASGVKVKKIVTDVSSLTTTEYAGNYIYENNNLQFFNTAEGYIEPNGSSYDYIYQYKDHLGNVRLSYNDPNGNYKVLSNDTFDSGNDGWSGNIVNENGRLKATVQARYSGLTKHVLQDFQAGEKVHVKLEMDKYTTTVPIRVLINERDANNNSLGWYFFGYAENGVFEGTRTIVNNSGSIYIKLDINSTLSSATQFYVDDIIVTRSELQIREENNYYPFGLKHRGYNSNIVGRNHKYGYNGKEEQDELGLGWIDITARNYNPELGRWMNLDPLAEKMRRHSPYNYGFDNPIYFMDPDGMMPQGGIGNFFKRLLNKARQLQQRGSALTTRTSKAVDNLTQPVRDATQRASDIVTQVSETVENTSSGAINDHFETSKALYTVLGQMGGQSSGFSSGLRFLTSKAGSVVLQKGAKFANEGEKKIANLLASEGSVVKVLKESTKQGVKTADFLVDGVNTELKTVSNLTGKDLSNSLKKRILSATKQSGNVIIDLTGQKGGTEELAQKALNRAFGSSDNLKSVRIIGEGFDITRTAQ